MGVTVDFIGLVYFGREGEQDERRLVLIPDGRNPGDGIEPHQATINIATEDLIDADWWEEGLETLNAAGAGTNRRIRAKRDTVQRADFDPRVTPMVTFEIEEPSTLDITGVSGKAVDATQQDDQLPPLHRLGLNVDRQNAQTIARMSIGNGTLRAMLLPAPAGVAEDGTALFRGAAISRLEVNGRSRGPVTITAQANGTRKTIRVREGAEIVIANISPDFTGGANGTGHHQIYRRLNPQSGAQLSDPVANQNLTLLASAHPFFNPNNGNFPEEKCSNSCC